MAAELRANDLFLVVGHQEPDGDCIASQLLLASVLNRLGKRVILLNEGPFSRPEIQIYRDRFLDRVPVQTEIHGALVVYLDCSTPERVGAAADRIREHRSVVVDHHASGADFGDVRMVDPARASVTLMVLDLMDKLGIEPDARDAELVFFGLCTDTAYFRHLGSQSADVFRTAARLVALGVSPASLYQRIYGGRSLEERRRLGLALSRTESHAGGRVLVCHQSLEERSTGSEELYRLLQTVEGVRIIVLIRQEDAVASSVSLRSTDLDVGAVAKQLGGGGHTNAAGCKMEGDRDSIARRVLDAVLPLVANGM